MKSWSGIQQFIAKHNLPYKVERWNMSLRGVLVTSYGDAVIAHTVKDAAKTMTMVKRVRDSMLTS
ncbi:MAG: hypothetical protein WCF30_11840 [Terracidiphilus sp.]